MAYESLDMDIVRAAMKSHAGAEKVLAVNALYERYDPQLARFIPGLLRLKGCHSVSLHSEGVRSKAWISILSKLDRLREPGSFSSWITVIAANAVKKHLRECIRAQLNFEAIDKIGSRASQTAEIQSDQRVVEAAIDAAKVFIIAREISSDFAEILYLHFWEDLDFHEIAELLGLPYSAVRTLYYRNRRKVYDHISAERQCQNLTVAARRPIEERLDLEPTG